MLIFSSAICEPQMAPQNMAQFYYFQGSSPPFEIQQPITKRSDKRVVFVAGVTALPATIAIEYYSKGVIVIATI